MEIPDDFKYAKEMKGLYEMIHDTKRADTEAAKREAERAKNMDLIQRLQEGRHQFDAHKKGVQKCVFQRLPLDAVVPLEDAGKKKDSVGGDEEPSSMTAAASKEKGFSKILQGVMQRAKSKHVEQPFEIVIPLGNERMKVSDIKKNLKAEYAARYCELLGVAPTQQNLNHIHRHMSLEGCKIAQVFNPGLAKGERRNYISIQPHYRAPPKETAMKALEEVPYHPFEMLPEEDEPVGNWQKGVSKTHMSSTDQEGQSTSVTAGTSAEALTHVAPKFDYYKDKFIFPYNLGAKFEAPSSVVIKKKLPTHSSSKLEPQQSLPRSRSQKVSSDTSPVTLNKLEAQDNLLILLRDKDVQLKEKKQKSLPTFNSGQKGKGVITTQHIAQLEHLLKTEDDDDVADNTMDANAEESSGLLLPDIPKGGNKQKRKSEVQLTVYDATILREIDQLYVHFTEEDCQQSMEEFLHDFPFKKYFSVNTEADLSNLSRAKALIASAPTYRAGKKFLDFLFVAYIAPLTTNHADRVTPAMKDQMFIDLYASLLQLTQLESPKSQLALDIPLLILALRVVPDNVFSNKYPMFSKSSNGVAILKKMDAFIMALIDPMGHASHLSCVESLPQALRIMHTKRMPARFDPRLTSPMTHFVVGDSVRSTEAMFLTKPHPLTEEGLQQLKMHLSPMVRSELLRIIAEQKLRVIPK